MFMYELDSFHCNLPGLIGVIGVCAKFTFTPIAIAIANGVTVAAHLPSHSNVHMNPCSTTCLDATNSSIQCAYAHAQDSNK